VLLAIDTATTVIGAALHDGRSVLGAVRHEDARRHGELLAPAVQQVLDEAGVDRRELTEIVCGVGPGPFTGLRVGVVTALVLAHALGLPAPRGICSLDALAHGARGRHEGPMLVATDARRKEVYWAVYDVQAAGARRLHGPGVSRAADLPEHARSLPVVGRGAELYADVLPHRLDDGPRDVDPAALASLAVALTAGEHPDAGRGPGWGLVPAEPLYLRRPDAVANVPTGPAR
jgi:tRNA threonylcarbamoyl adenosine modification protein YeaZ